MPRILRRFVDLCHVRGVSPWLAGGAGALVMVGSVLLSGPQGLLFSLAIAAAFLIGTAARPGPFHLPALAGRDPSSLASRAELRARIATLPPESDDSGQAVCLALAIDDTAELIAKHGRRAGTIVCAALAARLRAHTRSSDIAAALAPGRFGVLIGPSPRLDLESAVQTALRLQSALACPVTVDGTPCRISIGIGVALSSRRPQMPRGLLGAAEHALDVALDNGPGAIRVYDRQIAASPSGGIPPSDDDIARALSDGAIRPWFQPQIDLDSGALTGLETLARWHLPSGSVLVPGRFLDRVRRAGLSARLTAGMLDAALAQLAEWDRIGLDVPRVSVNLGAEDLADPALPRHIAWALDKHGLGAHRLGIEVLESVLASADPDDVTARGILAIGSMGCHVDLDDFGTGNTSLNAIRRFGVHRIKLDRSLVAALDTDPDQRRMVAAILTMADPLGVAVLAEGVETPGEHTILAQMGCNEVQGHAIAQPMPAPALVGWIRQHRQLTARPRRDTISRPEAASPATPGRNPVYSGKTA